MSIQTALGPPAGEGRGPLRVIARPAFANRRWNPYNWLLYSHLGAAGVEVRESTRRRVLRGGHDVLHLHWPEQHLNHLNPAIALARSLTLLAQLTWLRWRGTKVVWTVHNLYAHERRHPSFEEWFWRALVRRLDAYICLTGRSREAALARFPGLRRLPGHVVPHGDYREVYANHLTRAEARVRLALPPEARVLLFVGAIRAYKNVPALIDAFREAPSGDAVLVIAGAPADAALRAAIEERAGRDPRVRLHLGFVADDDLQLFLNAADVVVLPYRETLNSGSAILALSFGRPVVMPVSTCGEELGEVVGPAWVSTYAGVLDGAGLERAQRWATAPGRPASPNLEELSWPRIARRTAEVYAQVVGGVGGGPLPAAEGPHPAPLVTVVTPCHDAAPFIAETIASVAGQTHGAIEHIVVDDGSTDGSWEVIQRHAGRVRTVRLTRNRGGSHARNRGAELARGEFLMFLDADDAIAPGTVAALVAAVQARPGAIAFCDWRPLCAEEGRWTPGRRSHPLPAAGADPLAGWLQGVWVPPCAVLWRRDAYARSGGWDEGLAINQDGELMMRALAAGAELVFAPGGLGLYREHPPARLSVSGATFSELRLRSLLEVLERVGRALQERGDLERYRRPLGVAYQRLALTAFQQSAGELGELCRARGRALGGPHAPSRTLAGRLLARLLGTRRKEWLLNSLARAGVATAARRRSLELRRVHAASPLAVGAGARPRGGG
jgi:beta-1,4-mannosyltransferase